MINPVLHHILSIMGETNNRILPVGIQSFEKIRKEGLLYVDKTEIIWNLVKNPNSL